MRFFQRRRSQPRLVLGLVDGRLGTRPYVVPAATLTHHYVVFGPTGSGKSVLLTNLVHQIAALPEQPSLVVIDIKDGTLCEDILRVLPASRLADCIYFDIADTAYPI